LTLKKRELKNTYHGSLERVKEIPEEGRGYNYTILCFMLSSKKNISSGKPLWGVPQDMLVPSEGNTRAVDSFPPCIKAGKTT